LTSADVVFSPDGRLVLVVDDTSVRIVSVATRAPVKRIDDSRGIGRARFSPDSRRVLVVASTGMVSLHDVGDGHASNYAQFAHPAPVTDLQFSTDGSRLITACDDGVVRVWDTGLVGEQNDYFQSTFLSGIVLHATNQNDVRRNRAQWVSSLAIAPRGGTFATAGDDGWVRFWSVDPAPEVAWTRHGQGVSGLAATADGQTLVSASEYAGRVWGITPLRLRRTLRRHGNDLSSAGIAADGSVVMTADSEGKAFVFAGSDTAFVRAIEHEPGDDGFLLAVLSPDARLLATFYGPRGVKLWDPYSGRLVSRQAFEGSVRTAAFSPDARRIAVAVDRAITTWTIEGGTWVAGQGVATASPVRALAFDVNGNLAAGEDDGRVSVWSKDGSLLWQARQAEAVSSVQFSQDGRALATGGQDRTARVWSAADGTEWARLSFPFRVSVVQFVGHDQHLVVAGENYLYEVPWRTNDLRAVACGQLSGLDATSWERIVGDAPRAVCGSAGAGTP
jgi:WD40 repeat protein